MILPTTPSAAERTFLRTHARYASRLRVIRRGGGVELDGEVDSFYRKQLLLRDAAVLGAGQVFRTSVTVRRPVPGGQPDGSDGVSGLRVLLAGAEPLTLACCACELNCNGCDVTAADTGLGCLRSLRAGGYQVLVLIGDLPWGGSADTLHEASATGLLDRLRVIYVGDPARFEGLPQAVTDRLTHLTGMTPTLEQAVARAVAGCE